MLSFLRRRTYAILSREPCCILILLQTYCCELYENSFCVCVCAASELSVWYENTIFFSHNQKQHLKSKILLKLKQLCWGADSYKFFTSSWGYRIEILRNGESLSCSFRKNKTGILVTQTPIMYPLLWALVSEEKLEMEVPCPYAKVFIFFTFILNPLYARQSDNLQMRSYVSANCDP